MGKRNKLTLVGLIVVIVIISFMFLIMIPLLNAVKRIAQHTICPTNLKGLGTAMTVYANDYKDNFPQLPGTGPWSKELGFDYFLEKPDFKPGGAQSNLPRTITASWYLLVKYADVVPTKSFVCPSSDQEEFDGSNPDKRDITKLWDFGFEPHKHVSYVMHNPYGQYPADGRRSATFAVAADMSPYFENGNIVYNPKETVLQKRIDPRYPYLSQLYNALPHGTEGQNVVYSDGHTSFETRPDVGVKNDNIYTHWLTKTDTEPNDLDKRIGQPPRRHTPENDAKSKDDSFLAI
jgi:hypothetical protein